MTSSIYLAGPFFDQEQKDVMHQAALELQRGEFYVIDPQELSPVIVDLPPEQRTRTLFRDIYEKNIQGIKDCDLLVACIDWKDTGTSFELGYAVAIGKPTVTFSAKGKGANVMLAEATKGHCELKDLRKLATCAILGGEWERVLSDQ